MTSERSTVIHLRIALLFALSILMTACGSSNSSSSSNSGTPGALSGNWQMSLLPTGRTLARGQSGFLLQNGNTVTGGMMLLNAPCSGIGGADGSVNGAAVSLEVNPTGVNITLTGTLGTDQQSMSGSYILLATGCTGTTSAPETGTFTANLVTPLNGNLQGTFTSKEGITYSVTGQVSQGPNTGISTASLTGNLNVRGYCFSAANIAGTVSGTAVVMNLVDATGAQVGQLTATASLDGTLVTGKYSILAQTGTPPCGGGDGGTMTLNL